jgi:hypothetical protein
VTAPDLGFTVLGVAPERPAAAPTLRFSLGIDAGGAAVRSVMLDVQLRIAATQRGYDDAEQAKLAELFGAPHRWGETLRGLLWTQATLVVPSFDGSTVADLYVPCTYDFEVAAAKYLAALGDGDIPLELLFSGTVFYAAPGGALQVSRISWNAEAAHRLPVKVWREAIDGHFPHTAWLRLDRDAFDRLAAFKAARTLPSWEAALDVLLEDAGA